ncbi:essential MCU regulator, mitochondrial [Aplysia californica]|uniref:Essential MCU regulator, mitochondrial n=1 Tax=Aplysia californica TaxID=6500 RepID=A0ABM0K7A8_APLCA|nr:essential MCU regulator, mitochondrial [Aplysia californica]
MAASSALRLISSKSQPLILSSTKLANISKAIQLRSITTQDTGAVLAKPTQVRFGIFKVCLTVTPFLLGGATISREFAAWLEEHELFVPDDDDD